MQIICGHKIECKCFGFEGKPHGRKKQSNFSLWETERCVKCDEKLMFANFYFTQSEQPVSTR